MKKTVNVNLAGTFFHIDEDAYGKLTRYLDAIKRSLSDPQGSDEIIRDIEARIAELFSEKIESNSQVISIKELDQIIAVMGQPEDYMVDEEIFDDNTSHTNRKTSYSTSSSKKLYRDIDDKFISGVSSGIGHYVGIDTIWVRLIWIVLVLIGFGSPILIYILLWILVPAAESTSDKLKMTGEPVNISNIEKKFKEGYENVADKVKNADFDKYGQKVKSGASNFIDTLGHVFLTIFKIFVKFIGVIIIIVSLSTLIGLIIGLFTFGSIDFWGHGEIMDYISLVDITNTPIWIVALLALMAVGIPFFMLFIIGLKLLIDNIKSIGTTAKIVLFTLWILSLVGLGILGIRQATEQAYDGDFTTEEVVAVRARDTIKISMRADNKYSHNVYQHGGLKIEYDENDEKVIYSNDIRLIIRHTEDSIGKLIVNKMAEGNSFKDARSRAKEINYNYTIENGSLILDGFFITDLSNKYRDQEVELTVYLPIGTILFADENTYSFHRNNRRYKDILNNGDEEKYLLIVDDATECLNCPSKRIKDSNKNEADWVNEVENDFETDNDSDRIIINRDGVDINLTDKSDTLKIKLGN